MADNTEKTKRIAKNTMFLYFRMLFLMIISLYTSRVVLDSLGVSDYGIYNVVGGFVTMFSLISSSLTSACTRFLNYEMGTGNKDRLATIFSSAVFIQTVLALVVLLIAETVGVWYINNILVVPDDRLTAANWCFQFSLLNFCMNIITVPYNAAIVAHEKMKTFAQVSVFQGLANLGISFMIYYNPFDRLVYYGLLLFIVQFVIRMVYQIYCRKHFEECSSRTIKVDKSILKEMLGFSIWQFVGSSSALFKNQGVSMILNFFFGPAVNAAKGIANQINQAVYQFASNFMLALNPQITQSYAAGDYQYALKLVNKGSRLSFFLLFTLSLPILINADFILHIWLKEVPEYALEFAQLSLICALIKCLSETLMKIQNATGNIKTYQLVVGGIQMLDMPLALVALYLGYSPYSVLYIAIFIELICLVARLFMLPNTVQGFQPFSFIREVIAKCVFVAIVAMIIPFIHYMYADNSWTTFIVNSLLCLFVSAFVVFFLGCEKAERKFFINYGKKIIKRFI